VKECGTERPSSLSSAPPLGIPTDAGKITRCVQNKNSDEKVADIVYIINTPAGDREGCDL